MLSCLLCSLPIHARMSRWQSCECGLACCAVSHPKPCTGNKQQSWKTSCCAGWQGKRLPSAISTLLHLILLLRHDS